MPRIKFQDVRRVFDDSPFWETLEYDDNTFFFDSSSGECIDDIPADSDAAWNAAGFEIRELPSRSDELDRWAKS